MRAVLRWSLRIAGGLAALVVAALVGGYLYLRTSLPQTAAALRVTGLSAEVEILRDGDGIPHIFAASAADAYFGLGFVHAQDRLFQMEQIRLTGRGRLSEVLGRRTLDFDRFMRALDVAGRAERTYALLSPASRAAIDAYAAGVNAFLAGRTGALPPEFVLARHEPAPWTGPDSLLWGNLMALQLAGNWRDEIERARLAGRLSPAQMQALWPEWPADGATTLDRLAGAFGAIDWKRFAAALPPTLGPSQASNEWVVAGSRTRTGKPLLANDPHLSLGAPGQWYLVRLSAPDLTLVGATAPGVPALVLGHNGTIAWGLTTTNADSFDLFVERVDPADPRRYLTAEGSRPFELRREAIKVRGEPDVELVVRTTHHGVVVSDVNRQAAAAAGPAEVLALAFPAHYLPDRTAEAMFAVNRARNWDAFVAALADWQAPMQNFVYADTAGNIGFIAPARLPIRKSGNGWLPQPGWTGEADWTGFVPYDRLPRAFNPASGRIANANNRIVSDDYPVFITRDWDAPYRNRRALELLDAIAAHDRASMEAMLADSVSLFARDLLPRLAGVQPADERSRAALDLLRAWDGRMDRDRPEPLIFNAWLRRLARDIAQDAFDGQPGDFPRERPRLIAEVFAGTSVFCADAPTGGRSCAARLAGALAASLQELTARYGGDLARWRWGEAHFAPLRHQLFSQVPVLRDFVGFRLPTHGDFYTLNRGASRAEESATVFSHVHGASYRAVYDLADLDQSLFITVPGQSGNPLSPHWGDLAQRWADGKHVRIAGSREALARVGRRLVLSPAAARSTGN